MNEPKEQYFFGLTQIYKFFFMPNFGHNVSPSNVYMIGWKLNAFSSLSELLWLINSRDQLPGYVPSFFHNQKTYYELNILNICYFPYRPDRRLVYSDMHHLSPGTLVTFTRSRIPQPDHNRDNDGSSSILNTDL